MTTPGAPPPPASDLPGLAALAAASSAWPFEEAKKLIKRFSKNPPTDGVVFQTGYGPSGLPHIGTFGEVARTSMVRQALAVMEPGLATRLMCFSDDMDGLRRVPDNVPRQDMLKENLNKRLTAVPDPFGTHDSFGAHNNARLCAFLDRFGFEYEFISATRCYTSGVFDEALLNVLRHYDDVCRIVLPTLGDERRANWSPFLPLSEETGEVLMAQILERDEERGTITYRDGAGRAVETPVTGGRCKLQWKADWAMRWCALGVDYEMAGKDLIESVRLSGKICRVLGGTPPEGFSYELFLDENGEKISKSRGNGLSVDDWLGHASPESLSLFMYHAPRKAKRLFFDVIPKTVDDYLTLLDAWPSQTESERLTNPVWHIHAGRPPESNVPLSFSMLLNLASAANADDPALLWGFIRRYIPAADPKTHPELDELVAHAVHYFNIRVKPGKQYRDPSAREKKALTDLADRLKALPPSAAAEDIQTLLYDIGKAHEFTPLREWFQTLYQVLLGQQAGPRFGSFIALYGIGNTIDLIHQALARLQETQTGRP